jgi:hypothetical protein
MYGGRSVKAYLVVFTGDQILVGAHLRAITRDQRSTETPLLTCGTVILTIICAVMDLT